MPNKECNRILSFESKSTMASTQQGAVTKVATPLVKPAVCKTASKDLAMSPTPSAAESERPELLGSLTTQQQQRTSARVIKKLRLDPVVDKDVKSKRPDGQPEERTECETPNKVDDKDPLKFPTVKQRMPKALWSTEEKNLFFEALNEYGKDFDALTSHICAKMKKKGMPDVNLKTKTQVSHFYYRTWHKLSKHVHFDENVKKVAQELYALINYGELRKKVSCMSEKTCARLGEMVRCGSITVRARGRNLRVRTPACRALRSLNQITERVWYSRVCGRAVCVLRARDAAAWARVQAAAHNPRALVALALRTRLAEFIHALSERWTPPPYYKPETTTDNLDDQSKESDEGPESNRRPYDHSGEGDEELHLETDRMIMLEQKLPKRPVLHVGPKPLAEIHLPVVNPSEQLSSQKICFSSYLERLCLQGRDKDGNSKIRTPKRQRKDSTTEKDKEVEQKKFKAEDSDINKLMHIDETAIDGIELMANYKNILEDEEKPSTEDEKELKSEEATDEADTALDKDLECDKDGEREKDMSERDMLERDKDSFSEMEDDEKCDTDNESDQGKNDNKTGKTKFKNLKVKFRIRPKKRGGSIYTLVIEKDQAQENQESKPEEPKSEEEPKPDIDVEMAVKQIRKGWSEYDAGDLLIGDLYLMFGARSKLELDYWWAEPTPPLPQPPQKSSKPETIDRDKHIDKKEKAEGSVEESDTDIFSPKHAFGHDSNDALSGDERKGEQLASPEHKSSASSSSFKLVSKLINRPHSAPPANQAGMALLSDRLKRLLAMVGNPHVGANAGAAPARCGCGGVCAHRRVAQPKQQAYCPSPVASSIAEPTPVFRHPTPIAPKPDTELQKAVSLAGVPRWRRGRPRLADRRVVVQRLLPLLPKLPPPNNLIPVKIVPNSPPAPPKILPKPPPTSTSDLSFFYVLSESNGQFYFHDGDRRIPITPMPNIDGTPQEDSKTIKPEDVKEDMSLVSDAEPTTGNGVCHPEHSEAKDKDPDSAEAKKSDNLSNGDKKPETADIGNFLPSESMSLSPSRLLRETEGWFEGSVQDFSLSSFLGHLEGRAQPELAVDSQLHSLMAESSVDYVAKFADLAAEVTDEVNHLNDDLT